MMSTRKRKNIPKEENKDIAPLPSKATTKPKPKCHYRLCSIPNCTKQVQQGGVCCRHGAKTTRASCSHDKCTNVAKRGGLCRRHGAFKLETCGSEGCKRVAKVGEFCDVHTTKGGAKAAATTTTASSKKVSASGKRKIGTHEGCSNKAKRGGICSSHDMPKLPVPTPSPTVQMANAKEENTPNNNTDLKGGTTTKAEDQRGDAPLDFLCDYYEELYYEELYEPLPL